MRLYILADHGETGDLILTAFRIRDRLAAELGQSSEDLLAPVQDLIDRAEAIHGAVPVVDAKGGPSIFVINAA